MNNQDHQPGKAPIDLSYDVPDFSQMGPNTPVEGPKKPKKPKTKKVKPKLVVRNHPELTKGMKVGQKHKAMVHLTPTLIRNEESAEGEGGVPGAGGHRAEFDIHNITPMGPVAEAPTAAGAGEVPPNFSSLGRKGPASAPGEEEEETPA